MLYSTIYSFALAAIAAAAPAAEPHQSSGKEHTVIFSRDQDLPPRVEDVLDRLALTPDHPDVLRVFNNSAFRGFSAKMQSHCLDLLANMTDVSVVEEAVTIESMHIRNKPQAGPAARRWIKESVTQAYQTRENVPWGLQRISSSASMSGVPTVMDYTYSYANANLGAGADVYIIDSGIYTDHVVFGGRAKMVWSYDNQMEDLDGHGTHVAGTAAGAVVGVASNANILGIRALDADGSGWSSNVVAGIDFAIQQHDARKAASGAASASGTAQQPFLGSVLSLSLAASGEVTSITTALRSAISAGIHACVAAGNSGTDACGTSPASSGGSHGPAITAGSIALSSSISSFSNTGDCVDVYAPGEDVISAWIGGSNMINVLSGTSMATPHVTGLVAYAMANATLAADPGAMKEWVRSTALGAQGGVVVANNGVA